jgi:hypothetical protein
MDGSMSFNCLIQRTASSSFAGLPGVGVAVPGLQNRSNPLEESRREQDGCESRNHSLLSKVTVLWTR